MSIAGTAAHPSRGECVFCVSGEPRVVDNSRYRSVLIPSHSDSYAILFDRAGCTLARLPDKANLLAESKPRCIDLDNMKAETSISGNGF